MTKLTKGQVKTLALAYWNDSLDRGSCSSFQTLNWGLDNEYLKPVQVPRSEEKKQRIRDLDLGYSEEFINKLRTVYWLTEKGLELFKTTNNYKRQSPELKN